MVWIEILAIVTFVLLLGTAIYLLVTVYVCDGEKCKPFIEASYKGEKGSKEYVLSLLNEFHNDGIWPFPYIGAAILTPLFLWFVNVPINVRNFAIVFVTSFLVIYFLFSFMEHHYAHYITGYVSDYVRVNVESGASTTVTINQGIGNNLSDSSRINNDNSRLNSRNDNSRVNSRNDNSRVSNNSNDSSRISSDSSRLDSSLDSKQPSGCGIGDSGGSDYICYNEEVDRYFEPFIEGLEITFATPVDEF